MCTLHMRLSATQDDRRPNHYIARSNVKGEDEETSLEANYKVNEAEDFMERHDGTSTKTTCVQT